MDDQRIRCISNIKIANSINTTLLPNGSNCTVLATPRWTLALISVRNLPHSPCKAPLPHGHLVFRP